MIMVMQVRVVKSATIIRAMVFWLSLLTTEGGSDDLREGDEAGDDDIVMR